VPAAGDEREDAIWIDMAAVGVEATHLQARAREERENPN
jgi:hypothetical protein